MYKLNIVIFCVTVLYNTLPNTSDKVEWIPSSPDLEKYFVENANKPGIDDAIIYVPSAIKASICNYIFNEVELHSKYGSVIHINRTAFNLRKNIFCVNRELTFEYETQYNEEHARIRRVLFSCYGRHHPTRTSWKDDDAIDYFHVGGSAAENEYFIFRYDKHFIKEKSRFVLIGSLRNLNIYELKFLSLRSVLLNLENESLKMLSQNSAVEEIEIAYYRHRSKNNVIIKSICDLSVEQKIEACRFVISHQQDTQFRLGTILIPELFNDDSSKCIAKKLYFKNYVEHKDSQKMFPCYSELTSNDDIKHWYLADGYRNKSLLIFIESDSEETKNLVQFYKFYENVHNLTDVTTYVVFSDEKSSELTVETETPVEPTSLLSDESKELIEKVIIQPLSENIEYNYPNRIILSNNAIWIPSSSILDEQFVKKIIEPDTVDKCIFIPSQKKTAICNFIFTQQELQIYSKYGERIYINRAAFKRNKTHCFNRRVTLQYETRYNNDTKKNIVRELFPCYGRHDPMRTSWHNDDALNYFHIGTGVTENEYFIFRRDRHFNLDEYRFVLVAGINNLNIRALDSLKLEQQDLIQEEESLKQLSRNSAVEEIEIMYYRNATSYIMGEISKIGKSICHLPVKQKIKACQLLMSHVETPLHSNAVLLTDKFNVDSTACVDKELYFENYPALKIVQKMFPCHSEPKSDDIKPWYLADGYLAKSILIFMEMSKETSHNNLLRFYEFYQNVYLSDESSKTSSSEEKSGELLSEN